MAVGLTTLISFPPSLRLQPRLTWVHGARVLNCRSARKKRNQERQGRAGVKRAVGSHLEPQGNGQCDSCDRGKHRRCDRSKHCTAKERSPPGKNKRKIGEHAARARSYFERVRSACLLARRALARPCSRVQLSSPLDRFSHWKKCAAKAALKAALEDKGPDVGTDPEWIPIPGGWFAKAVDGRDHQDGDGVYLVGVLVDEIRNS